MNFAIRYLTEYAYDTDVVDNLNALRVKPQGNGRQRCDEFGVRLTPEVRIHRHTDYFGTEVVEFEVSRPHRSLSIDVRARVTINAAGARAGDVMKMFGVNRDVPLLMFRQAALEVVIGKDIDNYAYWFHTLPDVRSLTRN